MQRRPLQRCKMRYCLLQLSQKRLPRRVVLFAGQNINARAFIPASVTASNDTV